MTLPQWQRRRRAQAEEEALEQYPPEERLKVLIEGREARVHRMAPSPDRARLRSKTYAGIAEAMAAQWGDFLLEWRTAA